MIADQLSRPSLLYLPEGEFEYWSCHVIASGREIEVWDVCYDDGEQCKLKKSSQPPIHLPGNDLVLIRTIANVAELVKRPGVLFYSQFWNESLCDAAAVLNNELLLFQMTTAKDHSLKEQSLRSYCSEMRKHKVCDLCLLCRI